MEEHASKVKLTFKDDAAFCYCAYILHTHLVNVQETDFLLDSAGREDLSKVC